MENTTCQIQWIDSKGNPTPDTNPAIGVATCRHVNPDGSEDVKSFPICSEHLDRMPHRPSGFMASGKFWFSQWTFAPSGGVK